MKARQLWTIVLGMLLQQPLWVAAADDLVTSRLRDEARLWQSKDRDDLAAEAWSRLLIGDAQHGEALVSLGLIMARSGDMVAAKEWYARASRLQRPPADLDTLAAAVGLLHTKEAALAHVPLVVSSTPVVKPQPAPKPRAKPSAPRTSAPKTVAPLATVNSAQKAAVVASPAPSPAVVPVVPVTPIVTPVVTPVPEAKPQEPAPPKPRPSKALPYFPPL